ncbi:MAG: chemotaxis-specific protein-glutamate methyltransferase CheB [Chlamydiota bacterium]|nr:chemotaxis-specific protein-glutamate methyltransferase CheB [Chlamydiota bacterium]
MNDKVIRVLIAEDSTVSAEIIKCVLEHDPQIRVIGVATNGVDVVAMTVEMKPDIITMDIHMPLMDGLEAVKQVMAYCPTPVLILSSSINSERNMDKVFKAISYGALDVMEKKVFEGYDVDDIFKKELIDKIKFLYKINVITHPLAKIEKSSGERHLHRIHTPVKTNVCSIIGIVASTGGPNALLKILKELPKKGVPPIVVVQHITHGFLEGLVEWLDRETSIQIKVAHDMDKLMPGIVYFAPDKFQMRISSEGNVHLCDEIIVDGHKPSGTVLLSSIAESFGARSLGIILTGMGGDGATGIKKIHEAGGRTIAQDEGSCIIYGMPKIAFKMGVVDEVLPIGEIAQRLLQYVIG